MLNFGAKSKRSSSIAKFSTLAAVIAPVGIADSAYLTAKHYASAQVPCGIVSGCKTVLTSSYAEIFGIPTAAFGVFAYFLAFSLALLTAFGSRSLWMPFGALLVLMSLFTLWLIYLQAFIIESFCQFCLISAATTFSLLFIFLLSFIFRR